MAIYLGFREVVAAVILLLALPLSDAQCSNSLTPTNNIKTSVASGYAAAVVATGLTAPRSLQFDSAGSLLVLEQGKGLSSHVIEDDGGACVGIKSSQYLIQDTNVCSRGPIEAELLILTTTSSLMDLRSLRTGQPFSLQPQMLFTRGNTMLRQNLLGRTG